MKLVKSKMVKLLLSSAFAVALAATVAGCGSSDKPEAESEESADGTVTLTCLADATPHAEILRCIEDDLAAEGIKLDIVSEEWDATWNEQVENGDVDFHYDAYVPYLDEWNASNNGHLVGLGSIHLEPLVMCSETLSSLDELPDGATIAIKEDVTNQYRCLKLLEQAGLITLKSDISLSNADTSYIESNPKNLEIVAMDADVILNTRQDFDAYITNTNRLLEAGLDPTDYLVREDSTESQFANVICVNEANANNPAILKMVELLETDKVRDFINDTYDGAVIPAF
ncbi:Methionine-binding lipoprotein metQ precursor [Slackia heliotrinireducens]|uniref:ABC-type metal ion transport system, periplasmic component/surface antigen n=1 Tax=Slackia heliotrinireducens (strain ATCC 29202 / DSM 20476 / NCTC 11029 / RHS 1) TaxID=471855 RepID=C7N2S8_SLAHD|nr:MetQ/NlpA family ABC transporter substrate-binding protein [Slackia heliotrinireducens]ACV23586.1 ABC-type metal ion transport system, periplasmic component/surface antigen [Slackia heliotrinireducens DSM 20476]VEH03042.1 Methionine-binding lipoprotein metQ precursor [Slackia heliotrinireducens]